ncbi:MAG: c-type cytochrome [Acetobacteraceae bacterium]
MRGWLANATLLPAIGVGLALLVSAPSAFAQMPLPTAPPPLRDGKTLFLNQCGTCHSLDPADAPRQGPLLKGVVGRKAGSLPGFHYSAGFAKADFVWDPAHLDIWITSPQAMIPGAVMAYAQPNPETRRKIIDFLKEQQ